MPKIFTRSAAALAASLFIAGAISSPRPTSAEEKNGGKNKNPIIEGMKTLVPTYSEKKNNAPRKSEVSDIQNDVDARSIRESAKEELDNIVVFLAEFTPDSGDPTVAPVFMTDHKGIFGSKTDLSFSWVGYKMTLKIKQNNFPFRNTSLQGVLIGSFLYASGTNLGFARSSYKKENRFYTNYTSEMLIFRWKMARYLTAGYGLDSRQYFFVRRRTPYGFRMPQDHVNIFPYLILEIGSLREQGIDQLTQGILLYAWAGYGCRSRWDWWGEAADPQSGSYARNFMIASAWLKFGVIFGRHHNFVLRFLFKGGIDNDFLNRPRFGSTIDNARLDVVHGFTLDTFRVNSYCLTNMSYGFNLCGRLRLNFYFDYAHVFLPGNSNIVGGGYGFRIIAMGGLPVWFTHGMGSRLFPEAPRLNHAFSVMTAAGW